MDKHLHTWQTDKIKEIGDKLPRLFIDNNELTLCHESKPNMTICHSDYTNKFTLVSNRTSRIVQLRFNRFMKNCRRIEPEMSVHEKINFKVWMKALGFSSTHFSSYTYRMTGVDYGSVHEMYLLSKKLK